MISAKPYAYYSRFLSFYIRFILKRNFREIKIIGKAEPTDKAILLIGNHSSWWDGFFAYHLNRKVFRKRPFVMMLEEQLKKNPFLRGLGAFSVKKGSKSMVQSLKYASDILMNPRNLLLLFPQGKIISTFLYPQSFEKGWFRIIQNANTEVSVIFMVNLVEYLSEKRPTVFMYYKVYPGNEILTPENIELEFNLFLKSCIDNQNRQI
ncbi:MAG: lysophospholipid acyltransferase family protein [Bacteroidetes bacterium]|nr:lysophospholipid acyltransferase family protein [Bacteroidota bacterium]